MPLRTLMSIKAAAQDFFFLLSRGYPRETSLELVGNRYNLTKPDRDVLRRGIFDQKTALMRKSKEVTTVEWIDKTLMIDGHNVHITLESLLLDRTLVRANDGALRDVARVSRNFKAGPATEYIADLIARFFKEYPPERIFMFFDAPVSKSGELAALYQKTLNRAGIKAVCRAVPVPEREFDYESSIIASSDSAVIDLSLHWLDLPWFIFRHENVESKSLLVDFSDLIMMDVISWGLVRDWSEACKLDGCLGGWRGES